MMITSLCNSRLVRFLGLLIGGGRAGLGGGSSRLTDFETLPSLYPTILAFLIFFSPQ